MPVFTVGHDQIVVGMGGGLRLQQKRAAAEIERRRLLDGERRQDDLAPCERLLAQHPLVRGEIGFGAGAERAGELVVTGEGRRILLEGGVAEHMVGMHMGVDDVADRLGRCGADRFAQLASHDRAAGCVDHGDGLASHDEAGIGHVAAILRRLKLIAPLMHEHAGRDLHHIHGFVRRMGGRVAEQGRSGERKRAFDEIGARKRNRPARAGLRPELRILAGNAAMRAARLLLGGLAHRSALHTPGESLPTTW